VPCAPKCNDFEFPIIETTKLLVELARYRYIAEGCFRVGVSRCGLAADVERGCWVFQREEFK